jgi:hypothetical protein
MYYETQNRKAKRFNRGSGKREEVMKNVSILHENPGGGGVRELKLIPTYLYQPLRKMQTHR